VIVGNDSDLTVYGGAGADLLTNFHVSDVFIGGAGIDTIQLNTSNFINDMQNTSASIIRIARMSDDAWSHISSGYNNALLEADPLSQLAQGPAFYIESSEGSGIFQGEKIHFIDASGLVIDQISVKEVAPGLVGLHLSNLDHHLLAGLADDNVLGGWGNDVLVGNGGNDYLLGAGGNDILVGGAIDSANPFDEFSSSKNSLVTSQLFGGSGDDTLVVMDGEVQAAGGDGNDIFAFYETHANQNIKLSIKDLEAGDRIDLSYLYSGDDFQDRLNTILGNTALNKVASDGSRTINLSSLTDDSSDRVFLRIEQSQSTPESLPASGVAAEQQLSSQFVIDRSLTWHDDLSPLVYVA
jgi:Ca2+-binding RTX toxin-like protein